MKSSGDIFPAGIVELFSSLIRNKQLVYQMVRREVVGRYRGSIVGMAWSFLIPVVMLFIYTFVFSKVFNARWGVGGEDGTVDFAIVLFVGMIVHGVFAECISRAPQLIIANTSYVKKVVFPLEVMPWVAMGSALFHACICVIVLLVTQLVTTGKLSPTFFLFPLVLTPLVFATMGVAWFMAATGVFVRDIGQTTGVITTVLLFLSPVFYPVSALPENFQFYLMLNPLTFVIEQSRDVLVWGKWPNWNGLALYALCGLMLAWGGFWWFQKMRRGFADVL